MVLVGSVRTGVGLLDHNDMAAARVRAERRPPTTPRVRACSPRAGWGRRALLPLLRLLALAAEGPRGALCGHNLTEPHVASRSSASLVAKMMENTTGNTTTIAAAEGDEHEQEGSDDGGRSAGAGGGAAKKEGNTGGDADGEGSDDTNVAAESECTPRRAADPCEFVRHSGKCAHERIDYLAFHYCTVQQQHQLPGLASMIVLGPWMLLLFVAIGQAADTFFAPAVGVVADRLHLAPDVAGATLLAFGNAAADMFTQIAAIAMSPEVDLPLALGESVGAAVYTCTFALALVIFVSPRQVAVPPAPYIRDTLFYLLAVLVAGSAITDGRVSLAESGALLSVYAPYLLAVFGGKRMWPAGYVVTADLCSTPAPVPGEQEMVELLADAAADMGMDTAPPDDYEYEAEDSEAFLAEQCHPWPTAPRGMLGAVMAPFSILVVALQALTAPPMEVRRVGRRHAMVVGAGAPAFAYAVFLMPTAPRWGDGAAVLVAAAAGLALTHQWYPREGLNPRHSAALTAVAFVTGVAWMDVCANELVAVLEALGHAMGLPEAFLGATVLAWGASAGDTAGLLATARAGRGGMAISACFAGPIFQLVVGTGASLLVVGLREGDLKLTVHSNLPAMFGFIVVHMVFLCLVVPLYYRFRFTRGLAFVLMALFVVYVALLTATGLGWLVLYNP